MISLMRFNFLIDELQDRFSINFLNFLVIYLNLFKLIQYVVFQAIWFDNLDIVIDYNFFVMSESVKNRYECQIKCNGDGSQGNHQIRIVLLK